MADDQSPWEPVDVPKKNVGQTHRMKVPGGWLYRMLAYGGGGCVAICGTFVPDPPLSFFPPPSELSAAAEDEVGGHA